MNTPHPLRAESRLRAVRAASGRCWSLTPSRKALPRYGIMAQRRRDAPMPWRLDAVRPRRRSARVAWNGDAAALNCREVASWSCLSREGIA